MASSGPGLKRQFDGGDDFDPSKRHRNSASRVVFVCGLPADCLESELLALCCPFAVVEKSLMIPQKRQAFVQLPDVTSAVNLVTFYQTRDALIRGKKIFFEFSNRDEITVRSDHDAPPPYQQQQQQQFAQQPPPRADPYQQRPQYAAQQDVPPFRGDSGAQLGLIPDGPRPRGIGPPNQILMVSVSKIEYDVTVGVLQQVFQKFGNVQKIVTFWKDNEFKSLVQMESVDQAAAAQSALDGRDIYTGCNQLSIVFSRHPELRVRYNDDRSRDYTNPNLPPGPGRGGDDNEPAAPATSDRRDAPQDNGYSNPPAHRDDRGYRDVPSVGRDDQYAPDVRDSRGPPSRFDDPPPRMDRPPPRMDRPRDARGGRELPPHSTGRAIRGDTRPSPALICSNIDRDLVNPHRLFTLFGCFGDVLRIKIMFRKRDTALIQFVDEVHSTSALDHLDGIYVFGKKLRVDFSKHTSVSMPHADADRFEIENTLDFSGSPLHRYRRRSPEEAVSPCPLLHISGIPIELQRNQNALVDLFAQYGFVKDFHYLQNNKMALLEMGTMDEAIMALLRLDNIAYPDSHMRISFSKAYQGNGAGPGPGPGPMPGPDSGGWNPPMQAHPRERSHDRNHDRSRNRDRGPPPRGGDRDRSFRDRGPPPQRGRDFQPRDNSRRPPPRY